MKLNGKNTLLCLLTSDCISFHYECQQNITVVLAVPVTLSTIVITAIFLSQDNCCIYLKMVFVLHFFKMKIFLDSS